MRLKDIDEMFDADLRDPVYAAGYLNIALEDNGVEGFLYALQKVARVHGMSQIAEKSDLPRESLYRSLSEKGNPRHQAAHAGSGLAWVKPECYPKCLRQPVKNTTILPLAFSSSRARPRSRNLTPSLRADPLLSAGEGFLLLLMPRK